MAVPDVVEAAKDADILIFVVPHQFIRPLCSTLLGKIKPTAIGLSLIKVGYLVCFLCINILNKFIQVTKLVHNVAN